MQELTIEENDEGQRLDRFIGKYLDKAPDGFIHKMIRKKNIELNRKKAKSNTMLKKGDKVQLFLADETISKFRSDLDIIESKIDINPIYEDENILLMDKEIGILSHSARGEEENMVDAMISYLVKKGDYNPEEENSFIPSICNRLDRNTSGILIGAKNAEALRQINKAIRNRDIKRIYKTIVLGQLNKDLLLKDKLVKDKSKNKVYIDNKSKDGMDIVTKIKVIRNNKKYSLLEVELVSGRTHQIRKHLEHIGYPILGDYKYGDRKINNKMKKEYGLKSQLLESYKVEFNNMSGDLSYLNGKTFISSGNNLFNQIEKDIIN